MTDNDQPDLLGDPDDSIIMAIDRDQFVDPSKWPVKLAEITDVMTHDLIDSGAEISIARRQAQRLAYVIAEHYQGGWMYIPKGDALRRSLRNQNIWAEHDGTVHGEHGVNALARHYKLTPMMVFRILRDQRAIHQKAIQPDLFESVERNPLKSPVADKETKPA